MILEGFLSSLGQLVVPGNLVMLLLGVLIGTVVGLLPGVGAIVTMALMLPFVAVMDPFPALALMLGMYSIVSITGDLTAILIGVPGSAASAALVPDGFQLAKQGQANRAMGAAVFSSGAGAIIGAVILGLSIPVMRPIVLQLAAPEIFALTLLGLTMVGSLSGRSLLKGVIGAGFGLLLATVGPESQVGIFRYSFGQLYLLDGLALVPLTIGIFAVPELIDLHKSRKSIASQIPSDEGSSTVWQGFRDTVEHRWLVFRTSIIGAGIGAIPGLGAPVAAWAAYGHAVQSAKDPDRFGKGAIEGVLAPGAANNSKEGGGLIPTIAFGLPGTAVMAVLLGAFVVLGIRPGPDMVGRNIDVTFFMLWVLVVGNIFGVIISVGLLDLLAKVTFVRGTLLVPFVVILIFVGSVSSSGQLPDITTALLFGALGWVMRRYGWSVVPVVLGYVLGDRVETSMWLSISLHGYRWITRPIVLLFALGMVAMLWSVHRNRRRRKRTVEEEGFRDLGQILLPAGFLAVLVVAIVLALPWPPAARLFPLTIAIATLVLTLVQLGFEVRRYIRRGSDDSRPPGPVALDVDGGTSVDRSLATSTEVQVTEQSKEEKGSAATMFAYLLAMLLAVWLFGLFIAIPLFVLFYYRVESRESWLRSITTAALTGIGLYVLIGNLLALSLPRAVLL